MSRPRECSRGECKSYLNHANVVKANANDVSIVGHANDPSEARLTVPKHHDEAVDNQPTSISIENDGGGREGRSRGVLACAPGWEMRSRTQKCWCQWSVSCNFKF